MAIHGIHVRRGQRCLEQGLVRPGVPGSWSCRASHARPILRGAETLPGFVDFCTSPGGCWGRRSILYAGGGPSCSSCPRRRSRPLEKKIKNSSIHFYGLYQVYRYANFKTTRVSRKWKKKSFKNNRMRPGRTHRVFSVTKRKRNSYKIWRGSGHWRFYNVKTIRREISVSYICIWKKKKVKDTGPLNGFNSNQFKCTFHTINSPLIKIDDGVEKIKNTQYL